MRTLTAHRFPFPPENEQSKIVEDIDCSISITDKILSGVHQELTLLRGYRTRLFSDVVTGKLDIREIAAALMVEEEYTEPIEDSEEIIQEVERNGIEQDEEE